MTRMPVPASVRGALLATRRALARGGHRHSSGCAPGALWNQGELHNKQSPRPWTPRQIFVYTIFEQYFYTSDDGKYVHAQAEAGGGGGEGGEGGGGGGEEEEVEDERRMRGGGGEEEEGGQQRRRNQPQTPAHITYIGRDTVIDTDRPDTDRQQSEKHKP